MSRIRFFALNEIGSVQDRADRNSKRDCSSLATFSVDRRSRPRQELGRGQYLDRYRSLPCAYQNRIFRVRFTRAMSTARSYFHYLNSVPGQAKRCFFSHAKQTNNLCAIRSRELERAPGGNSRDLGGAARMVELLERRRSGVGSSRGEGVTAPSPSQAVTS